MKIKLYRVKVGMIMPMKDEKKGALNAKPMFVADVELKPDDIVVLIDDEAFFKTKNDDYLPGLMDATFVRINNKIFEPIN